MLRMRQTQHTLAFSILGALNAMVIYFPSNMQRT